MSGAAANVCGMEMTAQANRTFLVLELIVLAVLLAVGLMALYGGASAGGLILVPLSQQVITPTLSGAALSVCALGFLGVYPRFCPPYIAAGTVSLVSLVISLAFLNNTAQLTSLVNFGALTGFLLPVLACRRDLSLPDARLPRTP